MKKETMIIFKIVGIGLGGRSRFPVLKLVKVSKARSERPSFSKLSLKTGMRYNKDKTIKVFVNGVSSKVRIFLYNVLSSIFKFQVALYFVLQTLLYNII